MYSIKQATGATKMYKTRFKNMRVVYALLVVAACFSCNKKTAEIASGEYKNVGQIPTPEGFVRDTADADDFAKYLRKLPLKKENTVYLFNGQKKPNQTAQYAVIKMDVGKNDLQQCADAVIRLRAEYLYENKKYNDIHFNFTSGERADYKEYAEGYRAVVLNNNVRWAKVAEKDYGYDVFRDYLDLVFTYAGTASLQRELKRASLEEISPGDVFIQTGHPYGHAVIVIDVAKNPETGRKAFMLAQSFMPAQEIHVLKNPEKNNDPWFYSNFGHKMDTPEWTFSATDLRRF